MLLALGHVVGTQFFPSGNTASGGTGQMVDGFSCGVMVQTFHIHAHITIYHNGTQIALPVGMGIVNPVLVNNGTYTNAGTCFYNLHMHDMSGIIHMEAPAQTAFTLGEVFDIWGQPLNVNNVAGFTGPTLFYVGTTSTSVPAMKGVLFCSKWSAAWPRSCSCRSPWAAAFAVSMTQPGSFTSMNVAVLASRMKMPSLTALKIERKRTSLRTASVTSSCVAT